MLGRHFDLAVECFRRNAAFVVDMDSFVVAVIVLPQRMQLELGWAEEHSHSKSFAVVAVPSTVPAGPFHCLHFRLVRAVAAERNVADELMSQQIVVAVAVGTAAVPPEYRWPNWSAEEQFR